MMRKSRMISHLLGTVGLALAAALPGAVSADETCNSPYMGNLIKGQELRKDRPLGEQNRSR